MASGSFGRFAELIRVIIRFENLDELPEAPLVHKRTSFFSGLLKSENLPFDEEMSGGVHSPYASGLFASEPLPLDARPEPRHGRASFFTTLFSREQLPADPVQESGPVDRGSRR